jgi:hypothetical protein
MPLDTSGAAEERYFELLRSQPPVERLAQAVRLTRAVRQLAEASVRSQHPAATAEEIRMRLAARLYGLRVAQRLFRSLPADLV